MVFTCRLDFFQLKKEASDKRVKAITSNYSMWLFCRRYEGHLPSVLRDKSFEIMIDFKLGENTYRSQREVPKSFGRNNSRLL